MESSTNDIILDIWRLYATEHAHETCHGESNPYRYFYATLPVTDVPRTIRLIDLEAPKRGEDGALVDTPLAGRLRIARLQDSPSYTALSYVWAKDLGPVKHISCLPDGPDIAITANCHAALREIQKCFGPITIWVDSICINQSDEDEKVSQIPLMQEIYTWARNVYIWLGDGTAGSDRAMDYLNGCGSLMNHLPVSFLSARTDEERKAEMSRYWVESRRNIVRRIMFYFVPVDEYLWASDFNQLYRREWMHRAWTFQEMILASNPVILCGTRSLEWARFLNALYYRRERFWPTRHFRHKSRKLGEDSSRVEAMAYWRLMANIWLQFPRPSSWNGVPVRMSPGETYGPEQSFVEGVRQWAPRLEWKLRVRLFLLRGVLAPALLAGWGGALYALGSDWSSSLQTTPVPGNRDDKAGVKRTALVLVPLIGISIPTLLLVYMVGILTALVGMRRQSFLGKGDSDMTTQALVLSGIHAALRYRVSRHAHDRVFALDGILASFGVSLPEPDYKKPLCETYRVFLEKLIAWQPSCVALLIDAGSRDIPGAPSWVPNWDRLPSPWVSLKYTAGREPGMIPLDPCGAGRRPAIKVLGNKLILPGKLLGRICFKPCFTELSLTNSDADMVAQPPLRDLILWAGYAPGPKPGFVPVEMWTQTLEPHSSISNVVDNTYRPGAPETCLFRSLEPNETLSPYRKACFFSVYDVALRTTLDLSVEVRYRNIIGKLYRYSLIAEMVNRAVAEKRCVFALGKNLLGSGPVDLQVGDGIYLLDGFPAPMALRRASRERELTVIGAVAIERGWPVEERISDLSGVDVQEIITLV